MSKIAVYADWEGLHGPQRLGFLHSRRTRASELFDTAARALLPGVTMLRCGSAWARVLPAMLGVMMNHPARFEGRPFYPVVPDAPSHTKRSPLQSPPFKSTAADR